MGPRLAPEIVFEAGQAGPRADAAGLTILVGLYQILNGEEMPLSR